MKNIYLTVTDWLCFPNIKITNDIWSHQCVFFPGTLVFQNNSRQQDRKQIHKGGKKENPASMLCVCARWGVCICVSQQDNESKQVWEGERLLCSRRPASHRGDITTYFTLLPSVCVRVCTHMCMRSASIKHTKTFTHTHTHTDSR